MPHLFVDVSSHGFGHLAQVAPMLNALAQQRPDLQLTVRSGLAEAKLRGRIHAPFEHIAARSDFGYIMQDALRIDHAASASAYREAHTNWPQRIADEANFLRLIKPDLVFTDVAYLPLAGAAQAGIPALSMCSLNWADLFAHFYKQEDWAAPIHAQILAAYNSAKYFFRLTPSMAMPDFHNLLELPPIAALGHSQRDKLCAQGHCSPTDKLVLIAFGGIDKSLDVQHWPPTAALRYILPQDWQAARADMIDIESLDISFTDLLCSVDAIITKPGYGTFTEAACNGTPVLYQRRDDWPEQDALIDWLKQNARCAEIDANTLQSGNLHAALDALWAQAIRERPQPTGAQEAAALIAKRL